MNARAWAVPAASAAALVLLLALDANVALFRLLNGLAPALSASAWSCITVLGDGAVAFALGLFLARRRPDLLWAFVIALLLCALFVRVGKTALDVKRPLVLGTDVVHVIGPAYRERSFPSGHAMTAFAAAGIVALSTRSLPWAAIALVAASVVALSRIVVGVHWPLDVAASAGLGWIAALLALRWAPRWKFGLRPLAQTLITVALAGFAVLLVAGYDSGYADAGWLMRAIGLLSLAGLAATFLNGRRHTMDTVDLSLLRTGAPSTPKERQPAVSLVIPVFNEAENLRPLIERVGAAMALSGRSFEVLCVNDGSRDASAKVLEDLARERPWLKPLHLIRNYGQSVALQAGFDRAKGAIIVTLDADLQNDPLDIPRLLDLLEASPAVDMISGWRLERKDGLLLRRIPSIVANRLISAVTGVRLHDYGCALKAYRAQVIHDIKLYGELHRFIPALAADVGARIVEVPVNHFARARGESHYGIGRTLGVVLDLVWIKFLLGFLRRPMHAFGGVGLALLLVGAAALAYLLFDKLVLDHDIGGRPLLVLGALLALIGVQILGTGLLGELLIRIYHEPQGHSLYVLRDPDHP